MFKKFFGIFLSLLIAIPLGFASAASKKKARPGSKQSARAKPPNYIKAPLYWVDPWAASHEGIWVVYASTRVNLEGGKPDLKTTYPLRELSEDQTNRICISESYVNDRIRQTKDLPYGRTKDYFISRQEVPGKSWPVTVIGAKGQAAAGRLSEAVVCQVEAAQPLKSFVALTISDIKGPVPNPWIVLDAPYQQGYILPVTQKERSKIRRVLLKHPTRDPFVTFAMATKRELRHLATKPKIYDAFERSLGTKWSTFMLSPDSKKLIHWRTVLDLNKNNRWDLMFIEDKGDLETRRFVYQDTKSGLPIIKANLNQLTLY